MSEEKEVTKLKGLITPIGVARDCFINKPSFKFKPEGEYNVKLVIPAKSKATKKLMQQIEELADSAYEAAMVEATAAAKKKGKKAPKELKVAVLPFAKDEEDENNIVFSFKSRASFSDKETKEVIKTKPCVYDAGGKAIKVNVGSGSKLRISFDALEFYTALVGAGVSLRLKAVQIIELVKFGEATFESSGFKEEEGYQYSEEEDDSDEEEADDEDEDDVEDQPPPKSSKKGSKPPHKPSIKKKPEPVEEDEDEEEEDDEPPPPPPKKSPKTPIKPTPKKKPEPEEEEDEEDEEEDETPPPKRKVPSKPLPPKTPIKPTPKKKPEPEEEEDEEDEEDAPPPPKKSSKAPVKPAATKGKSSKKPVDAEDEEEDDEEECNF